MSDTGSERPRIPPVDAGDAKASSRIVVFLGGLCSRSGRSEAGHELRQDFAPLRELAREAIPGCRFVFFSYAAGPILAASGDPNAAWLAGGWRGAEPLYGPAETTDHALADHVAALGWLIEQIRTAYPGAAIDLIGFSLGGIVALSWAACAGAARLRSIHRILLISTPAGGVSSLGTLVTSPGIRHIFDYHRIGFGRGRVFNDLRAGSETIARLSGVPDLVDVASVENSQDYLVNGRRVPGQFVIPRRLRTIVLGRGVDATGYLRPDDRYVADLGGWDRHLRTTHHHILRGSGPAIHAARLHIVRLLVTDGPVWLRGAHVPTAESKQFSWGRRSLSLASR